MPQIIGIPADQRSNIEQVKEFLERQRNEIKHLSTPGGGFITNTEQQSQLHIRDVILTDGCGGANAFAYAMACGVETARTTEDEVNSREVLGASTFTEFVVKLQEKEENNVYRNVFSRLFGNGKPFFNFVADAERGGVSAVDIHRAIRNELYIDCCMDAVEQSITSGGDEVDYEDLYNTIAERGGYIEDPEQCVELIQQAIPEGVEYDAEALSQKIQGVTTTFDVETNDASRATFHSRYLPYAMLYIQQRSALRAFQAIESTLTEQEKNNPQFFSRCVAQQTLELAQLERDSAPNTNKYSKFVDAPANFSLTDPTIVNQKGQDHVISTQSAGRNVRGVYAQRKCEYQQDAYALQTIPTIDNRADIEKQLRDTTLEIEAGLEKVSLDSSAGAALAIAYIDDTGVGIATLGDSTGTVLYEAEEGGWKAYHLSPYHRPSNLLEATRIIDAGSYISYSNSNSPRVEGGAASSAALADTYINRDQANNLRDVITHEPRITYIPYDQLPGYKAGGKVHVFCYSDALDRINKQEFIEIENRVGGELGGGGNTGNRNIGHFVADYATHLGSTDNATVLVIDATPSTSHRNQATSVVVVDAHSKKDRENLELERKYTESGEELAQLSASIAANQMLCRAIALKVKGKTVQYQTEGQGLSTALDTDDQQRLNEIINILAQAEADRKRVGEDRRVVRFTPDGDEEAIVVTLTNQGMQVGDVAPSPVAQNAYVTEIERQHEKAIFGQSGRYVQVAEMALAECKKVNPSSQEAAYAAYNTAFLEETKRQFLQEKGSSVGEPDTRIPWYQLSNEQGAYRRVMTSVQAQNGVANNALYSLQDYDKTHRACDQSYNATIGTSGNVGTHEKARMIYQKAQEEQLQYTDVLTISNAQTGKEYITALRTYLTQKNQNQPLSSKENGLLNMCGTEGTRETLQGAYNTILVKKREASHRRLGDSPFEGVPKNSGANGSLTSLLTKQTIRDELSTFSTINAPAVKAIFKDKANPNKIEVDALSLAGSALESNAENADACYAAAKALAYCAVLANPSLKTRGSTPINNSLQSQTPINEDTYNHYKETHTKNVQIYRLARLAYDDNHPFITTFERGVDSEGNMVIGRRGMKQNYMGWVRDSAIASQNTDPRMALLAQFDGTNYEEIARSILTLQEQQLRRQSGYETSSEVEDERENLLPQNSKRFASPQQESISVWNTFIGAVNKLGRKNRYTPLSNEDSDNPAMGQGSGIGTRSLGDPTAKTDNPIQLQRIPSSSSSSENENDEQESVTSTSTSTSISPVPVMPRISPIHSTVAVDPIATIHQHAEGLLNPQTLSTHSVLAPLPPGVQAAATVLREITAPDFNEGVIEVDNHNDLYDTLNGSDVVKNTYTYHCTTSDDLNQRVPRDVMVGMLAAYLDEQLRGATFADTNDHLAEIGEVIDNRMGGDEGLNNIAPIQDLTVQLEIRTDAILGSTEGEVIRLVNTALDHTSSRELQRLHNVRGNCYRENDPGKRTPRTLATLVEAQDQFYDAVLDKFDSTYLTPDEDQQKAWLEIEACRHMERLEAVQALNEYGGACWPAMGAEERKGFSQIRETLYEKVAESEQFFQEHTNLQRRVEIPNVEDFLLPDPVDTNDYEQKLLQALQGTSLHGQDKDVVLTPLVAWVVGSQNQMGMDVGSLPESAQDRLVAQTAERIDSHANTIAGADFSDNKTRYQMTKAALATDGNPNNIAAYEHEAINQQVRQEIGYNYFVPACEGNEGAARILYHAFRTNVEAELSPDMVSLYLLQPDELAHLRDHMANAYQALRVDGGEDLSAVDENKLKQKVLEEGGRFYEGFYARRPKGIATGLRTIESADPRERDRVESVDDIIAKEVQRDRLNFELKRMEKKYPKAMMNRETAMYGLGVALFAGLFTMGIGTVVVLGMMAALTVADKYRKEHHKDTVDAKKLEAKQLSREIKEEKEAEATAHSSRPGSPTGVAEVPESVASSSVPPPLATATKRAARNPIEALREQYNQMDPGVRNELSGIKQFTERRPGVTPGGGGAAPSRR